MADALVAPTRYNSTQAERHEFWAKVITLQKESGLSRPEFCAQHNIDRQAFSRWLYTLKKANQPLTDPTISTNTLKVAEPTDCFFDITADLAKAETPAQTTESMIQLKLPQGIEIGIPTHFNQSTLTSLLQTLEVL